MLESAKTAPGRTEAPSRREAAKLREKLLKGMLKTVHSYDLIREGDRILVAISGGKDSYTLLDLLEQARQKAPVRFDLIAFHVDQAQPGYDGRSLRGWLEAGGYEFEILREDTYSIVKEKTKVGSSYCRICSRLRRGILYTAANRLGCNKVALGHHRDDSLETLLLNLFYAGRLQAMPAIYESNDGRFEIIRPLIECAEEDIVSHASRSEYPIIPCNLCRSQDNLKRVSVSQILEQLEETIPNVRTIMLSALKNVRPSHLLDREVAQAWTKEASNYPPRR